MKLEITKEDIKELLEIRILEKTVTGGWVKHLEKFPINIDAQRYGNKLRYYLYIEIHAIFMSDELITPNQIVFIHGSVFNTIVLYQIDKHMNNTSYHDMESMASDLFDCLNEIEEDINYITVWGE